MKTKQASSLIWYNRKGGALALVLVSLLLTYILALRAIDTGSLQLYFLMFVTLVIAANRSLHVTFGHRRMKAENK